MIPYARLVALRRQERAWDGRIVASVWFAWLVLAFVGWIVFVIWLWW